LVRRAAQEGAEDQGVARRAELGQEGVRGAGVTGVEGARGRREVAVLDDAGQVRGPGGVHGDPGRVLLQPGAGAAEVGRVDDLPGRAVLGDEGVAVALPGALVGVERWEVGRGRVARDVDVADQVRGDRLAGLGAAAPEVGRVTQYRID